MNTRPAETNYFSRNLKYLRKKFSINQQRVGERMNKAQTTIANWENKVSEPSIDELLVLTNFFGIDLADLIKTDIEKAGLVTEAVIAKFRERLDAEQAPGPRQSERKRNGYDDVDRYDSVVQEQSGVSAWVVLRMLRTIDKKIDALKDSFDKKSRSRK